MDLAELRRQLRENPGRTIATYGYHGLLDFLAVYYVKKRVPNISPLFVAHYEIANLVPNSPLHAFKQSVFHLYDAIDDRTGAHVGTAGEWLDKQIPEVEQHIRRYFEV